jgi:DNA-binding NarL/FixJ family response regulator
MCPPPPLTPKELEVLQALVDHGGKPELVAQALHKEVCTVRHQVSSMLSKTGCENLTDLVVWGVRAGVVRIGRQNGPN